MSDHRLLKTKDQDGTNFPNGHKRNVRGFKGEFLRKLYPTVDQFFRKRQKLLNHQTQLCPISADHN